MSDWYPLAQAWVSHPESPRHGGRLELFSDVDPQLPLAPGQTFSLTLSITPQDAPFRTYGYLLGDVFEGVTSVVTHKGLGKLGNGRYATYASGAEPRAVTLVARIADDAAEGSYLLPRIVVGVKRTEEERLVSSMSVSHVGFRVRRHWLPGRSMMLPPGGRFVIPGDYSPAAGLRLVGSTFAAHGTLLGAPDGSLTYQADHDHVGYDGFSCCFEDESGHRVWSEITVYTGDLSHSPGAIRTDG